VHCDREAVDDENVHGVHVDKPQKIANVFDERLDGRVYQAAGLPGAALGGLGEQVE
jgi:hypothetical protein